jgi:phage protein D
MSVNKPSDSENKIISYDIIINGQYLSKKYQIFKISARKKISKISRASIYIFGGDSENNNFNESNESLFDNGNEIEIKLGYEQKNTVVFKGIIDTHTVSMYKGYQKQKSKSLLVLECVDKAIKLTNSFTNEIFEDSTDTEIFNNIISKVNGLNSSIENSSHVHSFLPKYNNNDWDYIVNRAKFLGFLVINSNNYLKIKSPSFSSQSELNVDNNDSTVSFIGSQSLSNQYNKLTVNAIDSFNNEKKSKNNNQTNTTLISNDNFKISTSSLTVPDDVELNYGSDLDFNELENIANSNVLYSRFKRLSGRVKFKGVASVDLDSIITLNGFGDKFNNEVYVTEVIHELEEGVFLTEIGFGLNDELLKNNTLVNKQSNFNKISGLHIGKISEISGDPKNELRVKVVIPELKQINNSIWEGIFDKGIWAKLSHIYTSEESGMFFIPDIGAQVLISFISDDPKQPVVLGCLNTFENKHYKEMDEGLDFKAIVTKNKMMLEFNEKDNIISLSTNNGNKIVIDENNKEILISDENNNEIKTSTSGINISSCSDININASGDININSNKNLKIKSQADTSIDAANVINQAQVKFSANGSASSEMISSGSTTVKGSIVQIN